MRVGSLGGQGLRAGVQLLGGGGAHVSGSESCMSTASGSLVHLCKGVLHRERGREGLELKGGW